ncbi:MAG: hypothetical protein EPO61_04570 [Nitrospirae bacterium]|nr:MAG: hypothetical protein EPO61_04570 [Nitrospirota bacterium]
MNGLIVTIGLGLFTALVGCADRHPIPSDIGDKPLPVATLLAQVRGEVERSAGAQQAATLKALAEAVTAPVLFKQPLSLRTLTDPWRGFATLEQRLARVAGATASPQPLDPLLVALEQLSERAPGSKAQPAPPTSTQAEDHVAYLEALLAEAARLRAQALSQLTDEERQFLFDQAARLADGFVPQWSERDEDQRRQAQADRRFFALVGDRLDQASLLDAARLLASLDDEEWLGRVRLAFKDTPALTHPLPGITGPVLLFKNAQSGLLIIGGPGPNTYDLHEPVALLLDLGGDDTYRGTIAAATDVTHGVSLLLDLDGNDRYEASPLGLATGRLGVGLLMDRNGDDQYRLAAGSGGVGLAGIGLLEDREGDDRYVGSRLTQGAAIGGLGLLVDLAGNDTHSSFGYAIGFGGPLGTGALIDVAGHDQYQCGNRYPSRYNEQDAPQAKQGDAQFQYECFGMGAGVGQRFMPKLDRSTTADIAGGLGLILDLAGNDRSLSANFSQGVGYAFGTGAKLDLSGDDEHVAARYGQGAAAHFGVGLFVDAGGRDSYGSTGPLYNGAAAWDRSVALFVDGGEDDDWYDFQQSTGLGIAEQQSWSLFLDAGGTNRYAIRSGKGTADDGSMSVFIGR